MKRRREEEKLDVPEYRLLQVMQIAGIDPVALRADAHPDTGQPSTRLDVTIQQYSVFLVKLAIFFGHHEVRNFVDELAGNVQLAMDRDGETTFWLNGINLV